CCSSVAARTRSLLLLVTARIRAGCFGRNRFDLGVPAAPDALLELGHPATHLLSGADGGGFAAGRRPSARGSRTRHEIRLRLPLRQPGSGQLLWLVVLLQQRLSRFPTHVGRAPAGIRRGALRRRGFAGRVDLPALLALAVLRAARGEPEVVRIGFA